ncbi:MAG: hypothetical protein FWC53_03750, partial [Firmicutes bacterium]|nr:hypothetical protein [Bacillota bacterium]
IKEIFEVLNKNHISKEAIEGCLSVLARGKAEEIRRVFKVLNENDISKEAIEGCLYILAIKKAGDIKNIFDESYVDDDRQKHFSNIKIYMKLKQMYNRTWESQEIIDFCKKRNISIEEFIKEIILRRSNDQGLVIVYENIIQQGRSIFVGNCIPIDKDYLNENGKALLELSQRIARKYVGNSRTKDYNEVQSTALEIIMSKCGNLVYNLKENQALLNACIFNKVYKILRGYEFAGLSLSLTIVEGEEEKQRDIKCDPNVEGVVIAKLGIDLRGAELSGEETEIMNELVDVMNNGETTDYFGEIARRMGMDFEEVANIIEGIRGKMIKSGTVRERNGAYEFCE